jgi:TetR/AcrR family transcriptional regulator, fatty acid metabolism regulator protein
MATAVDRLPKGLQREETRKRILEAAAQVFAAKGFHNAAVDDIVKASGTSKGAVYFYFESKDQIFLCLVEDYASILAYEIQTAVQRGRGLVAQIEGAIVTLVQSFQRHRNLAKIVLIDSFSVGPEFQGKRMALKAMLVEVLRGYLDRAVEDGKIAPQDTETAAYVWLGAISEVVLRWLNTGKPDPLDEVLAPLTRLLLRSVGFSVSPAASR